MILSTQSFPLKLIIFSAWKVAELRTIIDVKTIYAFFFLIGFIISVHFLITFFKDGIVSWKALYKRTNKGPTHSLCDCMSWKRDLSLGSHVKSFPSSLFQCKVKVLNFALWGSGRNRGEKSFLLVIYNLPRQSLHLLSQENISVLSTTEHSETWGCWVPFGNS